MKNTLPLLLILFTLNGYTQQIALNFAGDNDWVTGTNNSLPQGNNPRTIETWIKYSTSRNDMSIFNYGTFSFNQKFTLHLYNGVYIIGEGNDLATGYNFNDGNWHHLAVTHNGTTTIVYVDGVIRGSRNTTYNTTGYSYQMGVSNRSGNWDFRFEGTIDELRVWNVARTQQEIIDNMYDNFNTAPGLIAFYHLNDGIPNGNNMAVTTVADATGNGNNGTLNNFALTGTSSNFVNDAIVLPMRLVEFTASSANCTATIKWKTTEESDTRLFVIEESTDGRNFFPAMQQQPANLITEYTYTANLPVYSSNTFYRLKITEGDKQIMYSTIINVNASGCINSLQVWPNPAKQTIILKNSATGCVYRIFSSAGLLQKTGIIQAGVQQVNISKFAPGLYFLSVTGTKPVMFVKE